MWCICVKLRKVNEHKNKQEEKRQKKSDEKAKQSENLSDDDFVPNDVNWDDFTNIDEIEWDKIFGKTDQVSLFLLN
jgi:hypothetical protein